jgi:hypothetical protein
VAIQNPVRNINPLPSILEQNTNFPPGISPPDANCRRAQVETLAAWLRSPSLYGQILRVLLYYIEKPGAPYRDHDLEVLLLVSAAMAFNQRAAREAREP